VYAVDGAMMMKSRLILMSDAARENIELRSRALLIMDVFSRRRPDLEEQLGILTRHFERLSLLLLLVRGEHEGFAEKIHWGPHGRDRIDELLRLPAEALGNPFVSGRKVEEILREKSSEIKPLEQMKWKGKKLKQEERQAKFQKECEEAIHGGMGDYYGDPERVKVCGTREYVQGDGETRAVVGKGEPKIETVMADGTALQAWLNSRDWPEAEEGKLMAEVRREWIETSEQMRKEGKDTVGGLDLEELGEWLKAGFGVVGEAGFGVRDSGFAEAQEMSQAPGTRKKKQTEGLEVRNLARAGLRIHNPEPRIPMPRTPNPKSRTRRALRTPKRTPPAGRLPRLPIPHSRLPVLPTPAPHSRLPIPPRLPVLPTPIPDPLLPT
jgi:hypothetical protein